MPELARRHSRRSRDRPGGVFLDAAGDDSNVPSGGGRCSLSASSGGAVIQVSTSSVFVRITGIAFE